jgi:hypothetical protein
MDTFAHANRRYCGVSCQNKAYRNRLPPGVHTEQVLRCRAKNPEQKRKTNREHMKRTRIADVRRQMLSAAKSRAKAQHLPFNLTLEDLGPLPEYCPVLGIPLDNGSGIHYDGSPSLDKIIPKLGYVRGNVLIVSMRANRLKSDATVAELRQMAEFYETFINNFWMKGTADG